ncbi:MAG: hypothetical protein WDW38_002669 [Sanguina aurantia]
MVEDKFFETRWASYQKVIKGNHLEHRALFAAALNHLFKAVEGTSPCTICDLGCGDAGPASDLLLQLRHHGSQIHRYIGVDLCPEALYLATANISHALGLPIPAGLAHDSTSCSVCDLGCGDAGPASDLLLQLRTLGVPIARYVGVDLSPPALYIGSANIAHALGLHVPKELASIPATHAPVLPLTTTPIPNNATPDPPTSSLTTDPESAGTSNTPISTPIAPTIGAAAVVGDAHPTATVSPHPAAESDTYDVSRGLQRSACDTTSGETQPGTKLDSSPASQKDGPTTTAAAAVPPAVAATYELVEADMLGYLRGCRAGSVDVLLSSFAVHHLSLAEKAQLLAGVARVLRPGAASF